MRNKNQLIDYDSNIQNHDQFVELLLRLRKLTKYIVIVQPDRGNKKEPLILKAMEKMRLLDQYKTGEWPGTKTSGYGVLHKFDVLDKSFFHELMKYEAFYFNETDQEGGIRTRRTDFGIDDIIFLDKDQQLLFYTTTHEGYSMIHPDVLKVDVSWVKKGYQ